MKMHQFQRVVMALVAIIVLAASTAAPALAQTPSPEQPSENPANRAPKNLAAPKIQAASPQTLAPGELGTPGTNFRYVGTLGENEVPYDPGLYINRPNGLYYDRGTGDLYVTEEQGYRVLRYNSAGVQTLAIGEAGVSYRGDYTFNAANDVALDANKNIWVADGSRVVAYDKDGKYLLDVPSDRPWENGTDAGRFDGATGIAFDGAGHMFVSEQNNDRVQVFHYNPNSGTPPTYVTTLGETQVTGGDNYHFTTPGRLAVDGANNLYVADTYNFRVQKCVNTPGTETWNCAPLIANLSNAPKALTVDGAGSVYFSENPGGGTYKCTNGTCTLINDWWLFDLAVDNTGTLIISDPWMCTVYKGDQQGNFAGPFLGEDHKCYNADNYHYLQPYIGLDAQDNPLIIENSGMRLIKLDRQGAPQWTYGEPGWDWQEPGFLSWPRGAAGSPSGTIFVANGNSVEMIDSAGNRIGTLGNGQEPNYYFDWASGITVDKNGTLYVSDANRHKVMVYNSAGTFVGQIGDGTCGGGVYQPCGPIGLAVDAAGNLYVADSWANRVLVYNSQLLFKFQIGETWTWGNDAQHFAGADDVAVDRQGRIYVADSWNQRVQVYDSTGAYLTTIGGQYGSNVPGDHRAVTSVEVDSQGRVYVADSTNMRIDMYEPGTTPGWRQSNLDGFGKKTNQGVYRMSAYGDFLYAGTQNGELGGELWRTADGVHWELIVERGFGNPHNTAIFPGVEFKGMLYVAASNSEEGTEIYRCAACDGSDWEQVVIAGLNSTANNSVQRMEVLNDVLYAVVDGSNGEAVWRTTDGKTGWTQVNQPGFGDPINDMAWATAVYNGRLYVVTSPINSWYPNPELNAGTEVWRCLWCDGTDWQQVNVSGFGNVHTNGWWAESFNGALYVATTNGPDGGEVRRCTVCDGSDWETVVSGDVAGVQVNAMHLITYHGKLYGFSNGSPQGEQMFVSANGKDWSVSRIDSWGDVNNVQAHFMTIFHDHLFVGMMNEATGGQVWQMLENKLFMPMTIR